jgi:DNA invertase Pin-like site-specific DNA recombinase
MSEPRCTTRLIRWARCSSTSWPTFPEFEVDLLRLRPGEGMAVARAKGRLKGRQPKLTAKQQKELRRMHGTDDYTISDLAELFKVFRPTVYRTLQSQKSTPPTQ